MEELKDNDNDSSELSAVVGALLDSLDDKNHDVRQSVIESLERIRSKDPKTVIHATIYFWEMHKKISTEHMASLLSIMSSACKHSAESLSADSASTLAELAVKELTGKTENEACNLLVEICKIHCAQAMGGLLTKLEPGIIPQPAIVRTIGKLAVANPHEILSFIKITLTIVLPMLNQMRDELLKQSICFMIEKFCEAINDYIMNTKDPSPEISEQSFKEEICSAFDFLVYTWLKTSRDFKSTNAILSTLVPMISLLPEQEDNDRIAKLVPVCLNLCKRQSVRLAATRVLAVLLNCTQTEKDKEAIRLFMDLIHQTLSEIVSIQPFEATRDTLLTHYEVLRCTRSLVILYPEEGLDRILQQLKSPVASHHARALVVLKHLINTLPEDDGTLQRIALNLQESLGENCPLQMVSAIVALMARPTFPLLPSQRAKFVQYMVSHCDIKACSEALYLLATTVDRVELWLWPCLVQALLDPACTESVISVLHSLTPLATKIVLNEESSANERDFPGTKVLARCLELLDNPEKRHAVLTFLISAAPLIGHQVKYYWDEVLSKLWQQLLQDAQRSPRDENSSARRNLVWEEQIVKWLEESVKLEGQSWGAKLADELALKTGIPSAALYLAAVCTNNAHISLLVELARSNGTTKKYARAVGICAKRHLNIVLKLMEEFCATEDARKVPVKLLGLVRDAKAAATAETAKAGLLQSYGEIAQRGDPEKLFPAFEKHILPWTIKQLTECKELSTKETGLFVLEQVASAVHPIRFPESKGLCIKPSALATLIGILQSSSGHRPLQLYPAILKAANSLICIPPALTNEEREIFLSAVLDKTIGASSEVVLQSHPELLHDIWEQLGMVSSEVISKSSDALTELVDILVPWMQSKSSIERQTTLLVLHAVLRSYCNNLDYTYSLRGKFHPGKLVGRILCWCADKEVKLRHLAVDCLPLSMEIAYRYLNMSPNADLKENIRQIREEVMTDDSTDYHVEKLTDVIAQKIPSAEIFTYAKGLIEGLLFCGEASMVASVALLQHFKINGPKISRPHICLVDNIIAQMRQMENISCKRVLAQAVASLTAHQMYAVTEILLAQPLPLDPGTTLCWKAIGGHDCARNVLDSLLTNLETDHLFTEDTTSKETTQNNRNKTAYLPSLAAIVALKHLLDAWDFSFIHLSLATLLPVLLKYFTGWLHVDPPVSLINTKYGYVPNRAAHRIDPHAEVYSVMLLILETVHPEYASDLPAETAFSSETHADENVILTVQVMIKCISCQDKILSRMAQSLQKLLTTTLAIQRAVAITFYAELIGKVDCGDIWIEAIINTLFEAKKDSSPLVRKYAVIGLARIAYLDRQIDEYFTKCSDALLDGLEEPANGEGGSEVALESLRGFSTLLSSQYNKPVTPRVVLALKPFVEKENWEMKLAAIEALGAIVLNWQRSVPVVTDDLIDHLLGYLPSLIIRLEDSNTLVFQAAQGTLCKAKYYYALRSEKLSQVISTHLASEAKFDFTSFSRDLINCLKAELPERAEELRNAVVRGYSRSENYTIRATSALLLGLFGSPRPNDVQRLLQLLRDTESIVRIRASQSLSFCFTF